MNAAQFFSGTRADKLSISYLFSSLEYRAAAVQFGILAAMLSGMSRTIVALLLLTCVVCPLAELFDTWDHSMQTGNDTEYALVVFALCVGLAYSMARLVAKSSLSADLNSGSLVGFSAEKSSFWALTDFALLLFDATSPPPLALRI